MESADGRRLRIGWLPGWVWRVCLFALALLILATGLAILNNNFSLSRPSKAEFVNRLDHSLEASANWTMDQFPSGDVRQWATYEGKDLISNPALAHMLVDCATTSGDSRLQGLATAFIEAHRAYPFTWAKMVDPSIATHPVGEREASELAEYQRWVLHGISPVEYPLSANERADMFSPTKNGTGRATHQLFSLYVYRKFNGNNPALEHVMNQLGDRIASEAALDFRVTDLYLQRVSFLLAAGRTDLVKPRWVERALAAQQGDGGWHYTWYGWGPTPYRYTFPPEHSVAHSTAQAMWMSCMLKYRYPEWIDKNYK